MTLRCALYARYSSDQQRAASIEDQFRICRERADREGWKIAGTYKDGAVSGASVILRPGVQALLEDAGQGAFDVVVAEALDRVSRDPGRCRRALQASPLRGRSHRDAGRGRDRRAPCRSQGDDERAVPEGPGGEDAPGPARPGGGRQVGRQPRLRLRRGEGDRCRRRAGPGRTPDQRNRGRDRAPHLPGVRGRREPSRDRSPPQRRRHPRPPGQALGRQHAPRARQAGNGHSQQRALYRAPGVEPPAPGDGPEDRAEGLADQPAGGLGGRRGAGPPHRRGRTLASGERPAGGVGGAVRGRD